MPRKAKEKQVNEDVEKVELKKVTSSKVKATPKTDSKKTTAKKSTTSRAKSVKTTSKKVTAKKSPSKKSSSSKTRTTSKKTSSKKTTKKAKRKLNGKKAISPNLKSKKSFMPITLEYYDLPYKYNKTVVKALAQNPNTLFVYWEISDEDRTSFIKKYGERFFHITKPVLVVHNLTDKYSYELDINDFANNWYIHVADSKCQYVIELGRRPIEYTEEVPTDYIYITSSNVIEAPNDRVLFFNENDVIYFKNVHTNQYTKRVIKPFLKHICGIYKNLNLSEENNSFDFKNPSSQNPTSNVL